MLTSYTIFIACLIEILPEGEQKLTKVNQFWIQCRFFSSLLSNSLKPILSLPLTNFRSWTRLWKHSLLPWALSVLYDLESHWYSAQFISIFSVSLHPAMLDCGEMTCQWADCVCVCVWTKGGERVRMSIKQKKGPLWDVCVCMMAGFDSQSP